MQNIVKSTLGAVLGYHIPSGMAVTNGVGGVVSPAPNNAHERKNHIADAEDEDKDSDGTLELLVQMKKTKCRITIHRKYVFYSLVINQKKFTFVLFNKWKDKTVAIVAVANSSSAITIFAP
eukprot:4004321-Ditylum_brightwellii.AAC.1